MNCLSIFISINTLFKNHFLKWIKNALPTSVESWEGANSTDFDRKSFADSFWFHFSPNLGGGPCPLPPSSPRSAGPAYVLLSYAVCNQLCRNKPLFSKSFVILNVTDTNNGKSLEIETMRNLLFKMSLVTNVCPSAVVQDFYQKTFTFLF